MFQSEPLLDAVTDYVEVLLWPDRCRRDSGRLIHTNFGILLTMPLHGRKEFAPFQDK
jgi:hypothetical protein